MSLSPGVRLGPYEVLGLLGAGGMGEVWRARDTRLDRDVAIKVLPEEFFEGEERRQRFEREARLLAALNHPNVAAIHSFEEIPGSSPGSSSRHILVMELVEGEPLSKRMKAGPIPMAEALEIVRDIAAALEAAHAKGIIHRDLKPGNVMISKDGRVKLLDFGLAKTYGDPVVAEDLSHSPTMTDAGTTRGVILGTAAYMSPEQARGERLDTRTDVWAFGVVLWELLTGKRLFRGQSTPDTLAAVLREPVDLKAVPLTTPRAVRDLLTRCLERDPEKRLASIGEARRALETARGGDGISSLVGLRLVPTVGVLILVAAGGVFFVRRSRESGVVTASVKRLAVLPFENLGLAEDEYFADGVADEIRGKVTSLPGVEVIARASSNPYRKTTKTPRQIAEELDVTYLLTATVRWEKGTGSGRVHVAPELVEVRASGAPASKWLHRYDAALTDVFSVQAEIATSVAHALGLALGSTEGKRLLERPTQNMAAYEAFLKGEEARNGLGKDVTGSAALDFYERAVALDPGFAQAWAGVSVECSARYDSDATPELAERARLAAEKAVALKPDGPSGYMARGKYERLVTLDFVRALEHFTKGRSFAPNDAELVHEAAEAEVSLGRWEQGIEHLRQAERFDPRMLNNYRLLGFWLICLRRTREARETLDRGLVLASTDPTLLEFKAITFLVEGDLSGARAILRSSSNVDLTALVTVVASNWDLDWVLDEAQRDLLLRLTPGAFDNNRAEWGNCLARAHALNGDDAGARSIADETRKALEERLRATPSDAYSHSLLGLSYAYLGRRAEAVREGERSVALRPVAKDAWGGAYPQHQLARIYILVGEHEKAIDQIEQLLKIPYLLTPAWLRIDPNFDPLRKNPRFQKLVAGTT